MENKEEQKLRNIWERTINSKFVYRSQSEEYLKEILKEGFDPEKDPYVNIRPKLERLYELVLNLEKKGHQMVLDWNGVYPTGAKAVKVSRLDLDSPFIDFTTDLKEAKVFVKQFQGGAIAGNVLELINEIKKFDINLTMAQKELIKELTKWAKNKRMYKNKLLKVRASSMSLQSAKIHTFEYKKYFVSPYGSFEHFKKVIQKYGIEKYVPYLAGEKKAYLRVISKIPFNEIKVLKNV